MFSVVCIHYQYLSDRKTSCSCKSKFLKKKKEKTENRKYFDKLIILEPGDIWLGVAEGNAGQHCFGFYQKG